MKNKFLFYLHLGLTLLLLSLIMAFSLMSGRMSSSYSRGISDFFHQFFMIHPYSILHLFMRSQKEILFERMIRKFIGHFFLFFLLGYSFTMTLVLKRISFYRCALISLFFGLVISLGSELLQFIPKYRGPGIDDFFINYLGYGFSCYIFLTFRKFLKFFDKKST